MIFLHFRDYWRLAQIFDRDPESDSMRLFGLTFYVSRYIPEDD